MGRDWDMRAIFTPSKPHMMKWMYFQATNQGGITMNNVSYDDKKLALKSPESGLSGSERRWQEQQK